MLEKENTVGWLTALSYNNQTEYFENAIDNYFNANADPSVYALDTFRTQRGDIGINNVIISGLGGLSLEQIVLNIKPLFWLFKMEKKRQVDLDKKTDGQTL